MPLGHTTRRIPVAIVAVIMVTGCSALPPSSRLVPRTTEIQTRTKPDRDPAPAADRDDTPATRKLAFDRLDELSPLPPAIEPSAAPPVALPPSLPEAATQAAPPATEAPNRDEAVQRAEVKTVALEGDAPKAILLPPSPSEPPPEPATPPTASVNVTAASTPEPAKPVGEPAKPISPDEIWRDGIQTLRAVARDRLKSSQAELKPDSPNWVVRDRLLGWLAEPDVDPDARSADDVARSRAVLKGLGAILDPTIPEATRATEIRDAIATLEARAPLEITELKLCRKVHGFGNIEPGDSSSRKVGQPVVLYCELAGLAYEPSGASFRSKVSADVEMIPEGSDKPAWTHALGTAEDVCRRRRRDFFVGHMFNLPDSLSPGNYRVRLTEKDLLTDHVATRETTITIVK